MNMRRRLHGSLRVVGWLVVLLSLAPTLRAEKAPLVPWPNGETLTYSISWGVIDAAQGVFTATDQPDRWEFRMHLISQGTVDTFYPINDWYWSFQQKSPWRSIEYGEDRSEGKRRVRERTRVDYVTKIGLREKWTKAEDDRIPITTQPLDDVGSMLYSLRCGAWKVGDKRPINVYESSELKTGEATCVSISKRTFDPWPELELIEIQCDPTGATKAKQKGGLTIWLTNDSRRLPILAHLSFKYGTFTIALAKP